MALFCFSFLNKEFCSPFGAQIYEIMRNKDNRRNYRRGTDENNRRRETRLQHHYDLHVAYVRALSAYYCLALFDTPVHQRRDRGLKHLGVEKTAYSFDSQGETVLRLSDLSRNRMSPTSTCRGQGTVQKVASRGTARGQGTMRRS